MMNTPSPLPTLPVPHDEQPLPPPPHFQSLMMNNPAGAVALAKMAIKQVPPPLDTNTVADLFLQVCMCGSVCVCVGGGALDTNTVADLFLQVGKFGSVEGEGYYQSA